MLELKAALSPYQAPGGAEADGSGWYIVQVSNDTVRPATRVLLAGQPPRAALSLLPRRTRPAILAVASSDSGTVVETASAYGRRAWRVIVPPVSTVGLAIRVGSADSPPALVGLDRAGAVLAQPPARHLHHRGGRADRRRRADHRRSGRTDRPCRAALGGDDTC